jgi:4'-phosphopantetheinyl transferase
MAIQTLWAVPAFLPALSSNETHVWCFDLDDGAAARSRHLNVLSPKERDEANRFRSDLDRSRYIAAHGCLREILAAYLDIDPHEVPFAIDADGKPRIEPLLRTNTLQFNMTHSAGLALYAVAQSCALGIDIEYVRPISRADDIVKWNFSLMEQAAWSGISASDKTLAFLRCWTQKEAYVKATGLGLSGSLACFSVSYCPNDEVRLLEVEGSPSEAERWSLYELIPAIGYIGALAVHKSCVALRRWVWRTNV